MKVDFPEQCLFINVCMVIDLFGETLILINFVIGDGRTWIASEVELGDRFDYSLLSTVAFMTSISSSSGRTFLQHGI